MAAVFLTDGIGGWLAGRVTPGRGETGMILGGALLTGATVLTWMLFTPAALVYGATAAQ